MFYQDSRMQNNIDIYCKKCRIKDVNDRKKTLSGLIASIYSQQLDNSRARGHSAPSFSNAELQMWLSNDWLFLMLYENWSNLNYMTNAIPSIDRIDDKLGYNFSNIRIVTWGENRSFSHVNRFNGDMITSQNVEVNQYTKDMEFVSYYESCSKASRITGVSVCNIARCCKGDRKTAGGFIWLNANN